MAALIVLILALILFLFWLWWDRLWRRGVRFMYRVTLLCHRFAPFIHDRRHISAAFLTI
jgi:hypothetical protein